VMADATQLRCALTNLAVNARDAMPNGGTLAIDIRSVVLDAEDVSGHPDASPGDYAVVELTDTGSGISATDLERIFEPFFTTKEIGKGTGLGLSMVYGFVKQSGGLIKVASKQGRGTTFTVYLPRLKTSSVAEHQSAAPAERAADQKTILVVDDNAMVLKSVGAQLRSLGYRTIEVDTPREALNVLARNEPLDLLLTDVVMPGEMNGIELARVARERKRDLKVLLTSGYPDLKRNDKSGLTDCQAILRKPYRRHELQHAISTALDGA
jgi:CheY-like chemotaxis protein